MQSMIPADHDRYPEPVVVGQLGVRFDGGLYWDPCLIGLSPGSALYVSEVAPDLSWIRVARPDPRRRLLLYVGRLDRIVYEGIPGQLPT